jgi:hypothetical protein
MCGGSNWVREEEGDHPSHYQYETGVPPLQDCLLRRKAGIIAGPCRNEFAAIIVLVAGAPAHHASMAPINHA